MSRSLAVSSLSIFLLVASCFAEKAPYTSFAQDATLTPLEVSYDYIIIGGGTAGCSLAATLSTAARVLVLERGGLPYNIPAIHKSGVILNLLDTSPTSAAQFFVSTDGVFNHRGRVLGGTSAINGGLYSRASDQEVRENGWDAQLVNESYHWVESKLLSRPHVGEWQSAIRAGLLEAGVTPDRGFTIEHLIGTKDGGTTFDENGRRHGAADLLEYADPNNISVYLHATVHQILFERSGKKPKANGVLFKDSKGISHKAFLNNKTTSEIILSAGALGSPQLLMLSGIGPAQELKAHGIEVILGQDLVGQGMSDNPMNGLLIPSPRPIELSLAEVVGISDTGNYIEAASGFIELNLAQVTMAENLANSANQTIIQPINQIIKAVGGLGLNLKPNTQIGLVHQKVAVPYSTGSLKLKTLDPNDNPIVTFNYYQDPRDLEKCIKGMEILKNVVESRSFSKFRINKFQTLKNLMLLLPTNLRTKHFKSIYSMEQYCIDTVMTVWHYHGGCQVDKVVDHDYKVIGVDSLRVIDGSTFLNSPGTNPHATLMMLGRYMGQRIIGEQGNR